MKYDVVIVGAGILGLAHAYMARQAGKSVVVIEKDYQAVCASIRNFGFVTVTGQQQGKCWQKAAFSRHVWGEIIDQVGIPVLQQGLLVTTRYPESKHLLSRFLNTDMAAECQWLDKTELADFVPQLNPQVNGALYSPHEVRIESKDVIPMLSEWLKKDKDVVFHWGQQVLAINNNRVSTPQLEVEGKQIIICCGDNFSLYADRVQQRQISRCKLQMLRIQPQNKIKLKHTIMSDLGLVRYAGYSELPEAAALKKRLQADKAEHLKYGVHLIVAQSADGSLVLGDSHEYAPTPTPFLSAAVEKLILEEFDNVLDMGKYSVESRWLGTYAYHKEHWYVREKIDDNKQMLIVTGGTGMTTSFAIADETFNAKP